MTASNPIEINGKSYDKFSLNLAITGKYQADGTQEAAIAARFIPTRIDGDEVIEAQEHSVNIALGSLSDADEPTLTAVAEISTALQKFILSKGL